jgi:ABC-type sugar transport system ATPase subunit
MVHAEPANRFVAGFFGWPAMNLIDGALGAGALGLQFHTAAGTLPIPGNVVRRWGLRPDSSVTMGIRPQHVNLALPDTLALPPLSCLVMEVLLVETVGNLTLVALKRNGVQLTGQAKAALTGSDPEGRICIPLHAGRDWKAGDAMQVVIDMEQAQWFDGTTGERLPGRPPDT